MRFKPIANNGVIIGTYRAMKEHYKFLNTNLDTMQMRPDMVSYWIMSLYEDF